MSPPMDVGLPEALERAAIALDADADAIRPANGDPSQLIELLDSEAATRVLEWLLENEFSAGCELAEAWVDDPERSAEPVLRANAEGLPKPARKALRRARHRLRSQGVEVEETTTQPTVSRLPSLDDDFNRALVSPLDPTGARMVYLVEGHPSGGARLFEVLLSEDRGVTEFQVYSSGRSRIRKFLRDFEHRDRFPGIETAPDAARALVERMASRQPATRSLPRGFGEYRSRFSAAAAHDTPGEIARKALAGQGSIDRVLEMLRERNIGPWPPPEGILRGIAEKLEALAGGTIIVSGAHKQEQVDQILSEAVLEVFAEPFGLHTAERYEETAFVLWKQGREEDANACLAAADVFRAGSVGDNRIARGMLEFVLSPLLERLAEGDEEAGSKPESLIATP